MHRDDIRDKVIELLHKEFEWIDSRIVEEDNLSIIGRGYIDNILFSFDIAYIFKIEDISEKYSEKWKTVKDIVSYIEVALQNKIGE